jgi:hypothetical protein
MKIHCPLCGRKVEVKTITSERVVPTNKGPRKMVEGIDAKGHKVAGFVSMNPPPPVKRKKAKKRRDTGHYFPNWG